MNEIQKTAFKQGYQLAANGFIPGGNIDLAKLSSWLRSCMHDSLATESVTHIQRDDDGEVVATTNSKARSTELAAYRLNGFFSAIHGLSRGLSEKGISATFDIGALQL